MVWKKIPFSFFNMKLNVKENLLTIYFYQCVCACLLLLVCLVHLPTIAGVTGLEWFCYRLYCGS